MTNPATNRPRVPEGPTEMAPASPIGIAVDPGDTELAPTARAAERTDGRRRDVPREMAKRVEDLELALRPFAMIPEDPVKPPEAILYILVRNGRTVNIHVQDIRRARVLLDLP